MLPVRGTALNQPEMVYAAMFRFGVFETVTSFDTPSNASAWPSTPGTVVVAKLSSPVAPLPLRSASLREPCPLGCFVRPFRQRCRDVLLIRLQRNPRFQDDDAVAPPLDRNVAFQPMYLAKARLFQHRGGIPTHIASPGIRLFANLFVIGLYRQAFAFVPRTLRSA